MPPRKINPISEKLWRMVHSGKTTKEKICVAADLKYPTLENVFARQRISYATLKSLKFAGIITAKDEEEYRKWIDENDPKRKKASNAPSGNNIDQCQESVEGAESPDDPDLSNSGRFGE